MVDLVAGVAYANPGTFQVDFIQMTIWIGYTTSLFLILFIKDDEIYQSLALKQIKWT